MAGVSGSQPSNLKNPTPNKQEQAVIGAANAKVASKLPDNGISLDQIFSEADQAPPQDNQIAPISASAVAPSPNQYEGPAPDSPADYLAATGQNFSQDIQNPSQALSTAGLRAQLSLLTTDKEKEFLLGRVFGPDSVRNKDGELQVKKPGSNKFENVDRKGFELGDVAALTGPAVDVAATIGGEAVGGLAGTAAGGPVGGIAGATVGGGLAQQGARDFIQSQVLDVPRDPSRNSVQEYGLSLAMSGVANTLGSIISKGAANVANAGIQSGDSLVTKSAQNMSDLEGYLKQNGLVADVKGGSVIFTPDQIYAKDPKFQALARSLNDNNPIKEAYASQAENAANAVKKFANDNFGQGIQNTKSLKLGAKEGQDAVGEAIGNFRTQAGLAARRAGNPDIPVDNFKQKINQLAEDIGLKSAAPENKLYDTLAIKNPSLDNVANTLALTQPNSAKVLLGKTRGYLEQLMSKPDGLEYKDILNIYDNLNALGKNVPKSSELAPYVYQMRTAIRDDLSSAIGNTLQGEAKSNYEISLKNFSERKDAADTLSRVLGTNEPSKQALVDEFFHKGGLGALDKFNALEKVADPQFINDLKAQWLNQAVDQASTRVNNITELDPTKLYKAFGKVPQELQEKIFDKDQLKDFQKLTDFVGVLDRIKPPKANVNEIDPNANLVKQGLNLAVSTFAKFNRTALGADIAVKFIKNADKKQIVENYLKSGGADEISKILNKNQLPFWNRVAAGLDSIYKTRTTIDQGTREGIKALQRQTENR